MLFLDENGESAIWEQFPNNPVGSFYIFVVDFLELIGNLPSQVLVFALHCLCACKTTLRPLKDSILIWHWVGGWGDKAWLMSEGRTKWVVPAHPPPLCQPLRKTILACIANKSFFLWHNPIQDLSNKTDIKKFKLLYYRNQPRHWSNVFLHWWYFNWFARDGEVDIGAFFYFFLSDPGIPGVRSMGRRCL